MCRRLMEISAACGVCRACDLDSCGARSVHERAGGDPPRAERALGLSLGEPAGTQRAPVGNLGRGAAVGGAGPLRGAVTVNWERVNRRDRRACALADRHYSRTVVGAPQVGGNARLIVLVRPQGDACWITAYDQYPKHRFGLVWNCTMFRNESPVLSSSLVTEAVAVTRYLWGEPPKGGMITFINAGKVRRKRDPGRCFRRAGFRSAGETERGLVVLRLDLVDMPAPEPAQGMFLLAPCSRDGERDQ